jgi:hypothetical protein
MTGEDDKFNFSEVIVTDLSPWDEDDNFDFSEVIVTDLSPWDEDDNFNFSEVIVTDLSPWVEDDNFDFSEVIVTDLSPKDEDAEGIVKSILPDDSDYVKYADTLYSVKYTAILVLVAIGVVLKRLIQRFCRRTAQMPYRSLTAMNHDSIFTAFDSEEFDPVCGTCQCLDTRLSELESTLQRVSLVKYDDDTFQQLLRDVEEYLQFVKSIVDEVLSRDDDPSPEISAHTAKLRRKVQQVLVKKATDLRRRVHDCIYANFELTLTEKCVADVKQWVHRVQGDGMRLDLPSEHILRVKLIVFHSVSSSKFMNRILSETRTCKALDEV